MLFRKKKTSPPIFSRGLSNLSHLWLWVRLNLQHATLKLHALHRWLASKD